MRQFPRSVLVALLCSVATALFSTDGIGSSGALQHWRSLPGNISRVAVQSFASPASFPSQLAKFYGGITDGRFLWLIPSTAPSVVRVLPTDGSMTEFATWPVGTNAFRAAKFAGGAFDGSRLWMAPFNNSHVVAVAVASGELLGYDINATEPRKFIGATYTGAEVWMSPYDYADTLSIASDGNMTAWYGGSGSHKFGGCIFDGTYVWTIPASSRNFLRYSSNGNWMAFSLPPTVHSNVTFSGAAFDGTSVWMAPTVPLILCGEPLAECAVSVALSIRVSDGVVTIFEVHSSPVPTPTFRGVVYDGLHLWFVPQGAREVVRVNPVTNATSRLQSPLLGPSLNKFAGAVFDGASIWLVPQNSDLVRLAWPSSTPTTTLTVAPTSSISPSPSQTMSMTPTRSSSGTHSLSRIFATSTRPQSKTASGAMHSRSATAASTHSVAANFSSSLTRTSNTTSTKSHSASDNNSSRTQSLKSVTVSELFKSHSRSATPSETSGVPTASRTPGRSKSQSGAHTSSPPMSTTVPITPPPIPTTAAPTPQPPTPAPTPSRSPLFDLDIRMRIVSPTGLQRGLTIGLRLWLRQVGRDAEIEVFSNFTESQRKLARRQLLQSDGRQVVQFRFTGESQEDYADALESVSTNPQQFRLFQTEFSTATGATIAAARVLQPPTPTSPIAETKPSTLPLLVALLVAMGLLVLLGIAVVIRVHRRGGRAAEGRRRRVEGSETTSSSGADTVPHGAAPFNPLPMRGADEKDDDLELRLLLTPPKDGVVPRGRTPKAPLNGRWADEIDEEDQVAAVVTAIKQHSRIRLPASAKHVAKQVFAFIESEDCPQAVRVQFEALSADGKKSVKTQLCQASK